MTLTENDAYKHPFFAENSEMKSSVFKAKVRELSKSNIYASLGQILIEYVSIAIIIGLNIMFPNPWFYIPSIMIIGSRMHGLLILMHDAAHYKFCNNKKLNDLICNIAITFPLFVNLYHWRSVHFAHHRDTGGEEDPDWMGYVNHPDYNLPMKTRKLLLILGQHMFGIKYLVVFLSTRHSLTYKIKYMISSFFDPGRVGSARIDGQTPSYFSLAQKIFLACSYIVCISLIIYFGLLKVFLLFWIAPLFLWTHFITKLRSYTEHCGLEHTGCYENTRTMYVNWFDIIFLGYSWNVGLHIDHHLFPSIPSYRLHKFHKIIKNMYPYNKYAHITYNGIMGVIQECTKEKFVYRS
jgi:fatty acid desaturase